MRLMERRRQHVVAKGKTADKLPWEIFALSEPANKIESSSHNSCSNLHCASKKKVAARAGEAAIQNCSQ